MHLEPPLRVRAPKLPDELWQLMSQVLVPEITSRTQEFSQEQIAALHPIGLEVWQLVEATRLETLERDFMGRFAARGRVIRATYQLAIDSAAKESQKVGSNADDVRRDLSAMIPLNGDVAT